MRKKQPEQVKQALEEGAIEIALSKGLGELTVQSVADAAGVTKGGFMHHFPSKDALLRAIFDKTLIAIDVEIDKCMAEDECAYGSFSRAYIAATFNYTEKVVSDGYALISILTLGNYGLGQLWNSWYSKRLERHSETDSAQWLAIARYAADGVWLSAAVNLSIKDFPDLYERLISLTRPTVSL
jgi:AcrR family transcriptional regulator